VDVRTFWCKNFGFFKNYGASARTRGRGLSQCEHFADKEEMGQFFENLCGRLLWTVPYQSKAASKAFQAGMIEETADELMNKFK